MKKMYFAIACAAFFAVSCDNSKSADKQADSADGNYCFLKAENKDTTTVSLTIKGSEVTGKMACLPYEKDAAVGTLKGTKDGELLKVVYNYTIEGNEQSEEKQFKLQGDKLLEGVGELLDPKDDGHSTIKDASKLKFDEVLKKITCK